jgi:predicted ABC-type ATPase
MTSKEIFEAIDLEKVGPELKTKLLTLEKATEGFTNDRVDARMDSVMNAFYNSIKDKKPEALKNIEVKEAVAEEVVVKTVNGKKKTTTRKVKRKVAGKRKKNTRKTPTPSKPLTKVTVSTIASEIRKPNETWSDALSRAKEIFRKRKDEQKAKSKKALDELRDFMKSDKYLKGWPRTYGKEKPDNDLERDLSRKALAPGRRVSKKTGKVYYENRDNRSDREANAFPRKIYLKGGGELPKGTKYYGLNEIESITLKGGETFNYYMDSKMSPVSGIYVSPKAKIVKDEFQTELKFEKGGLNKSEFFYVPQREVESVKLDETLHDGKVIDGNFLLNGVWMQKSSRTLQLEKEIRNRMKKYELGGEVYVEPTIIQNNPDYLVGTETMYEMFELGGEVMVQPTILQNNPDYITSTATMGEWFEKGGSVGKSWKPINAVYYDSNDYNYPYTLIIGNLAWGISEEFDEPVFRGNIQKEFFMSTWDFAQKSGFMMADAQLPTNVFDKVKAIRSKDFDTLRGKRYPINPNDYPAFFEKGGSIGFEGLARKVGKRYEGKPVPSDYQSEYGKTYSKEEAMEVGRKVAAKVYRQQQAKMAKGGVVYLYYGGEQPDEMMKAANESEAANIAMKMGAEHYYFVAQMAKGGYVAVSENNGYWYIMSTPSSKEKAQQVIDMGIPRGEVGKVVTIEEAKAYNKVIGREYLEKGGYVAVSENNGYWYIMSTPSSKEKAQQVIDMGVPRGEVGKVVTIEEAKAYNKVIGREYLEKGGSVSSSDKVWSVKVMLDDKEVENFMVRARSLKEARMMVEDYHEAKMEAKYGDDIYFEIKEAMAKGGQVDPLEKRVQKLQRELNSPRLRTFIEGDDSEEQKAREKEREEKLKEFYEVLAELRQKDAVMAKGGALYHRLMPGDEVLEIYKDYLIIENDEDFIYVIDFRPEVAKRIQVEEIEGENTIEAAKRVADRDFEYSKYAMGGSLEVHGLEEGDLIVEDEGAYINVLSEDGKIYYVDLGRGERSTEPPLPFEYGGKVKVFNIGTLAAKYGKKPQVVLEALREGADVEEEHTRDRVKAMQIAFDHLDEDFFYYPKLKAAQGGVDFEDYYEKGGQVPEQFLDSKGERKIDPKSIEELTDYVMALPQTKSIYFNEEAGEYVPSRRKLHADIINTFKKEVVCITEGQPIAIFMGGSPASGKSSFLRKYSPYLLKEEILKVDADEIRAMLPEYEGYNAAQTHLETKDIVNTLLSDRNIGIPCDFDLIYDGTMNSVKSYIPLMDILRKRGYKIFIVYMDNVPKDVIIKRALERYQKSGRFVPLEVIEDFFEKGKTAFNELKKDVDGYMVIDGSNQDYKIIEQGGIKLPQNREYSMLGEKIEPKDIPALYKKGGKTKKA